MPLHLQLRDLQILAELGEYGFLDSATLQVRHWPDAKTIRACQQRLSLLVAEGFIKKANLIVAYQGTSGRRRSVVGGSLPTSFALTSQGAEVLERTTGEVAKRVSRSEPAAATLLHRLEFVQARLAIDDACRSAAISLPEWIHEYDAIPGMKFSDPIENRFVLYERFQVGDQNPYCRPDASCFIRIPKPSGTGSDPLIIYWEIDRSTNSPTREREKAFGYEALLATRTFEKHWPGASHEHAAVRVFYVCPSQERIDFIVAELRNQPVARFYRFTTRPELTADRALVDEIWQDIDGKRYAILRR